MADKFPVEFPETNLYRLVFEDDKYKVINKVTGKIEIEGDQLPGGMESMLRLQMAYDHLNEEIGKYIRSKSFEGSNVVELNPRVN